MIREFWGEKVEKISLQIGKIASKTPLTPNQWSFISVLPAIYAIYLVYTGSIIAGAVWFGVAALMDLVDGGLARLTGRTSELGAYIDGVMDRFVDFLAVFSLFFLGLPELLFPATYWIAVQLYFALMPTFIVAYVNHRGAVPDPSEKVVWRILHRTEMFPLFVAVIAVSAFSLQWAMYLLAVSVTLSVLTTFQSFFLGIRKNREYRNGELEL